MNDGLPLPNQNRAFRVTGPFVAMIRYMIVRDLRQFSIIYLVFLSSFAQSIFFVNYRGGQAGKAAPLIERPNLDMREGPLRGELLKGAANGQEQQQQQQPTQSTNAGGGGGGSQTSQPPPLEQANLASLFNSYANLWMELFKMTLGVYDLEPYRHSNLARLLLLLFIYLIPILFNM